jgi:hypothetical protein
MMAELDEMVSIPEGDVEIAEEGMAPMMDAPRIPIPMGFEPPEEATEGGAFEVVARVRMDDDGLIIEEVNGIRMDGQRPEPEPEVERVEMGMEQMGGPQKSDAGLRDAIRATLALIVCMFGMSSCVVYRGDGHTYASVGTDATYVRAGAFEMKDVNQSKGLREAKEGITRGLLFGLIGRLGSEVVGETSDLASQAID